jgi:hypothetical protein
MTMPEKGITWVEIEEEGFWEDTNGWLVVIRTDIKVEM